MTTRTKSVAIIFATLLVGALIGSVVTGAIINNRVQTLQQLRMRGGLPHMIEGVIEPKDNAQREKIRAVLDTLAERHFALRRYVGQQHEALMDSLRADLKPLLTDEQMSRFDEWMESDRGPDGPPMGPPPGGPGFGPPGFGPDGPPPGGQGFGPPPGGPRHKWWKERRMQMDSTADSTR